MGDTAPDRDKDVLLAVERQAFVRWSAAIAALSPDARRSDGWTLLEVVTHLGAWHRLAVIRLERLAAGELLVPPDVDAFNARVRTDARGRSWSEVQAEAVAAREAFLAAVGRLPQELLDAHDGLGAFVVAANGAWHYEEHLDGFATGNG